MNITIHDEIGQWGVSARDVLAQLSAFDGPEVNVSIHSPGGDMFDGIAIYNALKAHPAKVVVTVEGLAASAASIIAMAGDEIRMPDNAYMMIHNPWGVAAGDANLFAEAAELFDRYAATCAGVYAKRTGLTVEEVRAMLDATTYMEAYFAKEKGFCDVIVEPVASIKAFSRLPQCMATDCPIPFASDEPPADEPPADEPPADEPAPIEPDQNDDPADEPPAGDEPPAVDPVAQAAEIVELCQLAGQSARAAAFIREDKTVEEVRGALAKMALDTQATASGVVTAPDVAAQLNEAAKNNLTVRSLLLKNKTAEAVNYMKKGE